MRTEQIAFIGGGNMAEAILGGLLAGGVSTPQRLRVADIAPERRAWLAETYAVNVTDDAAEAVRDAAVVILAVKPQQAAEVL
ncbi:MAG TPA: NAD(P)-binding domain-containing protein, partial [Kiritimatiellia bacterium]|nr:NAD(P)-binding domain-containing protein [Kiritimatiellia bacterium]HXK78715.1 NAD(P)-binding domain-containing protein [Kiritimatiellia bacterium]